MLIDTSRPVEATNPRITSPDSPPAGVSGPRVDSDLAGAPDAERGPLAPPGRYSVRLIVDGGRGRVIVDPVEPRPAAHEFVLVLSAFDPNGDGDTKDHVDIINMSLGSAFGRRDDPSAVASTNAAAIAQTKADTSTTLPFRWLKPEWQRWRSSINASSVRPTPTFPASRGSVGATHSLSSGSIPPTPDLVPAFLVEARAAEASISILTSSRAEAAVRPFYWCPRAAEMW